MRKLPKLKIALEGRKAKVTALFCLEEGITQQKRSMTMIENPQLLTDEECEAFRKLPGSFNDMVRTVFAAGVVTGKSLTIEEVPSCPHCLKPMMKYHPAFAGVQEEGYTCFNCN